MTDGNDYAFSIQYEKRFGSEDQFSTNVAEGLTKREYFAAMAMQGLARGWVGVTGEGDILYADTVAKISIVCADALINELNKNQKT